MKSSSLLPTAQTRQPDRTGLVHYEILADGLIHAATVFGLEPDGDFVPRVSALAFLNGAQVVAHHPRPAGRIAGLICQALEVGRDAQASFCEKVQAELGEATTPQEAAAAMVRRHFGSLSVDRPADSALIRCLVAGAVAAGVYSRSLAPKLFEAARHEVDQLENEEAFLASRLCWWSNSQGLPDDHPFMDLAARLYNKRPQERGLLCPMFSERLKAVWAKANPWALEEWLYPGWEDGRLTARYAPDLVAPVLAEVSPQEMERTLAHFNARLAKAAAANGRELLLSGFEFYAGEFYPGTAGTDELRRSNPRYTAVLAYDYAVWMGIVAESETRAEARPAA